MKQILVINNNEYINLKLFLKLSKFANISIHKLSPQFNLDESSYSMYDIIFIFVSRNVYEDTISLVSKMNRNQQHHFIFVTRNLRIDQKNDLLGLSPIMSFDATLINEELVYNLLSVIYNFNASKSTNSDHINTKKENFDVGEQTFLISKEAKKIVKGMHKEHAILLQKLSTRETELYELLLKGTQTKIIASKMGVNSSTISSFKNRIYKKLGVKNNVDLLRFAYQLDDGI